MASKGGAPETKRCPVCGLGVLSELGFDGGPGAATDGSQQQPDSRQVEHYSCGHDVVGESLATADADVLDVERRSADEVVDPGP
jgi:hypothetical protein